MSSELGRGWEGMGVDWGVLKAEVGPGIYWGLLQVWKVTGVDWDAL